MGLAWTILRVMIMFTILALTIQVINNAKFRLICSMKYRTIYYGDLSTFSFCVLVPWAGPLRWAHLMYLLSHFILGRFLFTFVGNTLKAPPLLYVNLIYIGLYSIPYSRLWTYKFKEIISTHSEFQKQELAEDFNDIFAKEVGREQSNLNANFNCRLQPVIHMIHVSTTKDNNTSVKH